MTRMTLTLFILLLSAPLRAFAQPVADGLTIVDFDDELVVGDLFNPDGEVLNVSPKPIHQSLIRAREHFIPEMFKSIEDL